MEELICLRGNSFIIPALTNIGIFEQNGRVSVIDSGLDADFGRKILKLIAEKGWTIAAIVNTHSHADHVGGNAYIQKNTDCTIWSTRTERAFIETPKLEAAFLWGGSPVKELKSRFFEAKPSRVTNLFPEKAEEFSDGLTALPFTGHFFDPVVIITSDRVCYLGDCLLGEDILKKHPVPFIYDIGAYIKSLEQLPLLPADIFVPSHGPTKDSDGILSLARANLESVHAVEKAVLFACAQGASGTPFDDILAYVCVTLGFELTLAQYALAGSTLKSFLSYLHERGAVQHTVSQNKLRWKTV